MRVWEIELKFFWTCVFSSEGAACSAGWVNAVRETSSPNFSVLSALTVDGGRLGALGFNLLLTVGACHVLY